MTTPRHVGSPEPVEPTVTLNVTERELFVLSKWAVLATEHATATEDIRPALSLSEKVDHLMDLVGLKKRAE